MGVPEERDVRHRRALEDLEERRPVGEVAVRFHDHRDAAAFRVLAERAQPLDHPRDHRRLRLAGRNLVGEHAHVGDAEAVREIDEAPALIELGLAHLRIGFVHSRGRTEIGNLEVERGQVLQALVECACR